MAKPRPISHTITIPTIAVAGVCTVLYLAALSTSAPEPLIELLRGGMLVFAAVAIMSIMHVAESRDTRAEVRAAQAEVQAARAEAYAQGRADGYVDGYIHARKDKQPASPEEIEAMRPARLLYPVE